MSRFPKTFLLLFLGLGFCAFFSRPAHAYMWQTFEINPRVSLRETYDDNVTYLEDNRINDFITKLLLGFTIKHEGKLDQTALDVNVSHELFLDHSSFNNTSEDFNLGIKTELSKYNTIRLNNSFSHQEDPRNFEDAFGRTGGRYFTFKNIFDLAYRHDLNEQLGLNLRYGNDWNHPTRKDLSDSTLNSLGTGLDYIINTANIVRADYDFYNRDFDPGQSSNDHQLTVGLKHYLTNQLYLDVQSGADFIDSFNGDNEIKPLLRAALTNDLDETTRAGITFEKKYRTTSYNQDVLDSWRLSLKMAKHLTDRIQGYCGAFYGRGEYVTTHIKEQLSGLNIGADYALAKEMKLNLSYTFTEDDSTLSSDSYLKNTIYMGISAQF